MGVLLAVPNVSCADASQAGGLSRGAVDLHFDPDHGRAVFTFGGDPDDVLRSCLKLVDQAVAGLDLARHVGVHPRFGVIDVLPLVPYGMDDAAARTAAAALSEHMRGKLGVPVYTYERAHEQSRSLPELRRELTSAAQAVHPTAGVVCLGIRDPLVAFNVSFRGPVGEARRIARAVRSPPIRALALELPSRGLVQVSMNLVAPEGTGPRDAFERVERMARGGELALVDCEVVGLVPGPVLPQLEELPLRAPVRSIEQAISTTG